MPPTTVAPRGTCALLRKAGLTRALIATRTTHAVSDSYLGQLDLPVKPGNLAAVRTVEANWPRITKGWLVVHGPVTFRVILPSSLVPGTVVEWADAPDSSYEDRYYTVLAEVTAGRSVTFLHTGRGPRSALEASSAASKLRDHLAACARLADGSQSLPTAPREEG